MDVETHLNFGIKAYESGDFPEAVFHLERVSRARPEDAAVLMRLGNAFKNAGQYERAVEIQT